DSKLSPYQSGGKPPHSKAGAAFRGVLSPVSPIGVDKELPRQGQSGASPIAQPKRIETNLDQHCG
ncbi:MAG: hypothetical protein ACUVTH_13800, partial [Thermogutta sp.]